MNRKKVIGIVMIAVCVLYFMFFLGGKVKNAIFIANAERTIGYVTDVQTRRTRTKSSSRSSHTSVNHTMSVMYMVDGVEYTTVFNSGESVVSEGRTVVVYYKKSNPKKTLTSVEEQMEPNYSFLILVVLGVLYFLSGLDEEKKAVMQGRN